MGLLSLGTPLAWENVRNYTDHVRKHGIEQFLHIYKNVKGRQGDELKWGDEVEYYVVELDDKNKRATLKLRSAEILQELQKEEEAGNPRALWRPEYGSFMIESTPGNPYGSQVHDFVKVEENMVLRRKMMIEEMKGNEIPISLTSFPRMGCPNFTSPAYEPYGPAARSLFIPDQAINPHARFPTLTRNIRTRRGRRVIINVPIYKDVNTPNPFIETFTNDDGEAAKAAKPDHIYMDAMCFGMGCSCLQATFQACSIEEARNLYDQLAVLTPIMLALSAGAPIFRGYLADVDCRWDVIAGSVDDRTTGELGETENDSTTGKPPRFRIPKSRYDSISAYIGTDTMFKDKYNDIDLVHDKDIYQKLVSNGIDHALAMHISHLFIRDPLVIYEEKLNQDNANDSDHFENIQSTNWQTTRFKPPPPNSPIGWRVEFRSMEVQTTDFENAAYIVFIVLITRVILSFRLNLYVPLSLVDVNMKRAQKRDAVLNERFHFRKQLSNQNSALSLNGDGSSAGDPDAHEEMDMNTIINGKPGTFPGLIPLIHVYLNSMEVDLESRCTIHSYLALIGKRASGQLKTTARWMRDEVLNHPEYKKDSVVSDQIAYDLIKKCDDLVNGRIDAPELLGNNYRDPPQGFGMNTGLTPRRTPQG
eukprot:Clim_evm6s39 gene=Clim_evmTU6s39